ncbi:MAG: DUF3040 domain-containing protein [Pseudonocardia sp.]|nr:DUF3040 domain-containing protein [Pseudonocardia sp.]
MLDDDDRNALRELESRLAVEDPAFVQTFGRHQERMSQRLRPQRGARIAMAIAFALGVLLLLLGSPVGALGVTVTVAVVWLFWRCSIHADRRSPP